jgi:hypothetical protein
MISPHRSFSLFPFIFSFLISFSLLFFTSAQICMNHNHIEYNHKFHDHIKNLKTHFTVSISKKISTAGHNRPPHLPRAHLQALQEMYSFLTLYYVIIYGIYVMILDLWHPVDENQNIKKPPSQIYFVTSLYVMSQVYDIRFLCHIIVWH